MHGNYKSRGSYAGVHGSLKASWTEPYVNTIGFLCNSLCFILHVFKHYSERSIHRLHQVAKGPWYTHKNKVIQESDECLPGWVRAKWILEGQVRSGREIF